MANWLGDFVAGDVVYVEVCFVDGTTSAPTAVSSGSAYCKRLGGTVVASSGVGAITTSGGLCTLAIFTGSLTSYFVRGDYSVIMGAGTVSGTSVVGYTLAQFSIGRSTATTLSADVVKWNGTAVATPATAGIPDVNVKNYNNGAVSSAATGIPKVDIDTIKTNPVVNGGTITFPTTATLASTTNITAGTITTVTNLTNAPTAGDFTSTMKTSIQTAVTAVTVSADVLKWNGTAVSAPATAGIPEVNVKNINNVATTAVTTVKAVQGLTTADQVTTAVNLTTNNDKTGYALSAAGNNSAADAFLLRDIATGASVTDRNVQNTFRAIRNKTLITTTGQLIVFQEDDIATAWTAVTTTTTAQSIASIDPA